MDAETEKVISDQDLAELQRDSVPPPPHSSSSPSHSNVERPSFVELNDRSSVSANVNVGAAMGPCQTCVFVLERIKKGTQLLLPAICSEIYSQSDAATYANCHQTLNSLALNGNNVRYWLFEGCYKVTERQTSMAHKYTHIHTHSSNFNTDTHTETQTQIQ